MAKRTRVTVRWSRNLKLWVIDGTGGALDVSLMWSTRAQALKIARGAAARVQPSQLVVYTKRGRISFEHTYPRASDPRRHAG